MPANLTILFTSVEAHGHVNSCVGVAQRLHQRGHRIVFIIGEAWKGKLVKYGFEEVIMEKYTNRSEDSNQGNKEDEEYWTKRLAEQAHLLSSGSTIEILKNFWVPEFTTYAETLMNQETPQLQSIIASIKPNLIVYDNYVISPAVVKSGIPWVWLASINILYTIDDENTPPGMLGLPIEEGNMMDNKQEWIEVRKQIARLYAPIFEKVNDWLVNSHSLPPVKVGAPINLHPPSPYANIYVTPKEIDYTDLRPLPDKWHVFDNFMRKEFAEDEFKLPECLEGKEGKLIYISMGTVGCGDLNLMKRLIQILSESKHRFIFSKGPYGDKYELAENIWGENNLPQTKIIPLVDLVITHGGNNTVAETFYFGKPMIVMPIFVDQFDNAQRIQEKGLGLRLNAYKCSKEELLDGIDRMVNDDSLKARMAKIGERIRNDNNVEKVADLLLNVSGH